VVCVRETNSELRLLRDGLKGSFCPASSCARGVVLSATNDGICLHFNDGRRLRTPGDKAHRAVCRSRAVVTMPAERKLMARY